MVDRAVALLDRVGVHARVPVVAVLGVLVVVDEAGRGILAAVHEDVAGAEAVPVEVLLELARRAVEEAVAVQVDGGARGLVGAPVPPYEPTQTSLLAMSRLLPSVSVATMSSLWGHPSPAARSTVPVKPTASQDG